MKSVTAEEWAVFKRKYPTVAKLAERLDEENMVVFWNDMYEVPK